MYHNNPHNNLDHPTTIIPDHRDLYSEDDMLVRNMFAYSLGAGLFALISVSAFVSGSNANEEPSSLEIVASELAEKREGSTITVNHKPEKNYAHYYISSGAAALALVMAGGAFYNNRQRRTLRNSFRPRK